MIPNADSYCEIDPNVVDQVGHPRAALSLEVERQRNQNGERHAGDFPFDRRSSGRNLLQRRCPTGELPYGIAEGGKIIHEVGTARMGNDPKTSVLNKNSQAHDVKNVFVTDAASFVTNPDKNPTLSIMALSWKASEYLLASARKGEI